MSERKIWINFEAHQRFILAINPWKKCSDWRLIFKLFGRAVFEVIEVGFEVDPNLPSRHVCLLFIIAVARYCPSVAAAVFAQLLLYYVA